MAQHNIPEIVQQELLQPNSAEPAERVQGGLSNALVYRCLSPHGDLCLRRWPDHQLESTLIVIRKALALVHAKGTEIVPRFLSSRSGTTYLPHKSTFWELTDWMPGCANYLAAPSPDRLRSAMQGLAALHNIWSSQKTTGISPAAKTRRDLLADLVESRSASCWLQHTRDTVENQLTRETILYLEKHGPPLLAILSKLAQTDVPLHYAIRDIWSDHVLFSGDELTGIIDFGAMRIDEPATDLARLIGSLEPHSRTNWQQGVQFYAARNPTIDLNRVAILDHASCLLSAVQWAKWLVLERREFNADRSQLLGRWSNFLLRLERFEWGPLRD